jgi:acetyl esterase/lipase
MTSKSLLLTALFFSSMALSAQNLTMIPLWPEGVPESNGITAPEITDNERISNVTVPSMTVYPAAEGKNTGVAVVICPGGAYARQAAVHEGTQIATWLSENGITAFLLKYRLPNGHAYIPGKDALQAIRIIRTRAKEWGVKPNKIGISGFSAGGHLASTAGTHFTPDSRPNFMILFYPVISMDSAVTHNGSKKNLLGESVNHPDSVKFYSNALQVTANTPPTLLLLSDDDGGVPPRNSYEFYGALKDHKVPASLHIFPEGGHGWGYKDSFRYHETWKGLYLDWLKQQKFVE